VHMLEGRLSGAHRVPDRRVYVSPKVRGETSVNTPLLATARSTRYRAPTLVPVRSASYSTLSGPSVTWSATPISAITLNMCPILKPLWNSSICTVDCVTPFVLSFPTPD
jgi:hypothetical protein